MLRNSTRKVLLPDKPFQIVVERLESLGVDIPNSTDNSIKQKRPLRLATILISAGSSVPPTICVSNHLSSNTIKSRIRFTILGENNPSPSQDKGTEIELHTTYTDIRVHCDKLTSACVLFEQMMATLMHVLN